MEYVSSDAHLLWNGRCELLFMIQIRERVCILASNPTKRAPTRSESFKNLSVQWDAQCSCSRGEPQYMEKADEPHSFRRRGFGSKVVATRVEAPLEYIFKKSCIRV